MMAEVWTGFHIDLLGLLSETKESQRKKEFDQNKDRFPIGVLTYVMTHSCVYMVYDSKPC